MRHLPPHPIEFEPDLKPLIIDDMSQGYVQGLLQPWIWYPLVGSCLVREAWVRQEGGHIPSQGMPSRLDSQSHSLRFVPRRLLPFDY